MLGASSGVEVGRFAVLITNGGTHSPRSWAAATADLLIEVDPGIAEPKRLEAALLVKKRAVEIFGEAFDKLRSLATREESDTARLAIDAVDELRYAMRSTPWGMALNHPTIRKIAIDRVRRSMNTIVSDQRNWST